MLVNVTQAGWLLGRRADLVRYYGSVGKIPVARRKPMRFTLASVLAAREVLKPVDRRKTGRRPRLDAAKRILEEVTS